MPELPKPFLRRVRLRNYKSIAECDVELGRFTLLVGRNGAGKSNFLDALRFISDALMTNFDQAVRTRSALTHQTASDEGRVPRTIEIRLQAQLGEEIADYELHFDMSRQRDRILGEALQIFGPSGEIRDEFVVERGQLVRASRAAMPAIHGNRLTLSSASDFASWHEAFSSMSIHNFNPSKIREVTEANPNSVLAYDGGNLRDVLLEAHSCDYQSAESQLSGSSATLDRLDEFVGAIAPEIRSVWIDVDVPMEHWPIQFNFRSGNDFAASSVSDGTLRALASLVAGMRGWFCNVPVSLVGIEEPETALHPAAAGCLIDALRESAMHSQILVTTHSSDLLDRFDPETDSLLVVQSRDGKTEINPVDAASRETIAEHVLTAGELLRQDQLQPEARDLVAWPTSALKSERQEGST